MIEKFSKTQFESVLPKDKNTNSPLWYKQGFIKGEYQYSVPIIPGVVEIIIRSSVDRSGFAQDTGQNSIRCWLYSPQFERAIWKGDKNYVTRQSGWNRRLTELLRKLYKRGQLMARYKTICCGVVPAIFRVKQKGNPKQGKLFFKCLKCNNFCGWVPETF